jgi:hypothetical protein
MHQFNIKQHFAKTKQKQIDINVGVTLPNRLQGKLRPFFSTSQIQYSLHPTQSS